MTPTSWTVVDLYFDTFNALDPHMAKAGVTIHTMPQFHASKDVSLRSHQQQSSSGSILVFPLATGLSPRLPYCRVLGVT
jgi:hypothetical protein